MPFRSIARSTGPKLTVDRPVDWPPPEGGVLSVGRLAEWLAFVHVPCRSVDRDGDPTPGPVNCPVDRQSSLAEKNRYENLVNLIPIKSHKIT